MIADYKVLLDACVLANYAVCDLYLRLAEHPRLLLPKWTEDILKEVRQTYLEKLDLIVTFNLKHFKPEHLKPWQIKAVHPQDYLLFLYSMKPKVVVTKISRI